MIVDLSGIKPFFARILSASARPYGPVNPEVKLADGYDYHQMPLAIWAPRAGLDTDTAALAWTLASEAGDLHLTQYAWAIGEAVINAAGGPFKVAQRVCGDKRFGNTLMFGKQGGRWCSTWQHPDGRHVELAKILMGLARGGQTNVIAAGARQWTDNRTQHNIRVKATEELAKATAAKDDEAIAKWTRKLANNPTPEEVMDRRYHAGARWVGELVDAKGERVIDPWILTLLGPNGVAKPDALLMLVAGRKQWKMPIV
jgi:hypothetical protein